MEHLKSTLCKAVNAKTGLPCMLTCKNLVVSHPSRNAAYRELNQSRRKKCVAFNKNEMSWRSWVLRRGLWRCQVWSLSSWFSVFHCSRVSSLSSLFFPLKQNLYPVPLYVGCMWYDFHFHFVRDYIWESTQKTRSTLNRDSDRFYGVLNLDQMQLCIMIWLPGNEMWWLEWRWLP